MLKWTKVLLSAIVVLSMAFAGCIKPDPNFASPIGAYPKITVDFVDNTTKVYVHGYTEVRYLNMTIKAFRGNVTYIEYSETNVFSIHQSIKQKEFTLNITVQQEKGEKINIYTFEGDFTVRPASDASVLLQITVENPSGNPRVYNLKDPESDFPWSTLGERIE